MWLPHPPKKHNKKDVASTSTKKYNKKKVVASTSTCSLVLPCTGQKKVMSTRQTSENHECFQVLETIDYTVDKLYLILKKKLFIVMAMKVHLSKQGSERA